MTTRERILALADGGHEPHMIAALLNLGATDVARTLAEPEFTPPEPEGGGGLTLFRAHLAVVSAAGGSGGDLDVWLPPNEGAFEPLSNVVMIPQLLKAGEHGVEWWVEVPTFSAGTLEITGAELEVINGGGSQRLFLAGPREALVSANRYQPDMTGWTVRAKVGEDLALSEDGLRVVSTAGGYFMASLLAGFTPTGLTA